MKPEVLCKCGAMRMLDPSVSCQRGNWIHAVSKCEPTCDECRALLQRVEALREERDAAAAQSFSGHDWNRLLNERDAARAAQKRAEEERDEAKRCEARIGDSHVALLHRVETAETALIAIRDGGPSMGDARLVASRALAPAPPAALRPDPNTED